MRHFDEDINYYLIDPQDFSGNYFTETLFCFFLTMIQAATSVAFLSYYEVLFWILMVWKNQELRALIRWVFNGHSKMPNLSASNFFCIFELPLWIY